MSELVRGPREITLLRYYSKLNENMKKYMLEIVQAAEKYQEHE